MLYFDEYFEINPSAKGYQWADRLVTHFRQYWKPLVSSKKAEEGMNLIMSRNNVENLGKMFKDPKQLGFELLPISVIEKIRNILIGERVKAGISVNMDALDPASEAERSGDRKLLESRAEMEELFTFMRKSIGMPPYKLSDKKAFKGNVDMFDELGLNSDEPDEVGYFFQTWHRLLHEMDAQFLVNYFIEYNNLSEYVSQWVDDVMAKKAIAMQVYVNELTGAIDMKYLLPERVRVIPGKRNDGKDAVCVGYEDGYTVSQFIKMVGSEFDMENDLPFLLNAVNYSNNTDFTGIWDGDSMIYGTKDKTICHVSDFMQFKVQVGYIEWKSWDGDAQKMGVDYHGNLRYYKASMASAFNEEGPVDTGYKREVWYNEYTYKAFFLSCTSSSQKLYKYGKLYHQAVEGAEDEYANYSVIFKKEAGPTIAEVARPWIELAQECFTKFRWMVRKAKPKGRAYNYESLVKIGSRMIRSGNTKQDIQGVIKLFEEGINEIFAIPEVGGERVGGGVNPNYDLPNGLDPTGITFKDIIEWCVANVKEDLAITQLREAYNPKPNDGLGLQMAAKESSENATNYIGEMLDSILRNGSKSTLLHTQDIIRWKDSRPYNFIKGIIGDSGIMRLKALDNVAHHRYGIFINSFNTYMQRQQIKQDTAMAWQQKEITYDIKILIDSIKDWRKAAFVLAFEKARADKQKRKEIMQAHQNAMALEKQKSDMKMAELDREWGWRNKVENTRGWWYFQSMAANNQSKEELKRVGIEHEPEKQDIRTNNKIREMAAKNSLEQGAPLPAGKSSPTNQNK